jgi:alpha-L-arabinofuranosidase
MKASESKPLVEFVAGDQPRIEVFAQDKRGTPVSRRLYGQFAEHLFDNVYFGMWAQLLRNPGFEPGKYFSRTGNENLEGRLEWRERLYGVPGELESFRNGAALYWNRFGEGDATYSLSEDKVNSDSSQKIEIRSLETPELGIRQSINAPTQRTGEYEVSVWAKGSCKSLHAAVRTTDGGEIGGAEITGLTQEWTQHKVKFSIKRDGLDKGQALLFTLGAREPGTVLLDQCFLFPADNMKGFDPDVVRMLREAKLPLLRWPGGNFVSGYFWKEGVGPVDERPMRNNPAWNIEETNHVGTDEWMTFCELVGCEPLICVNAGNGTPEDAADWVEYCNGDISTKYGALRAKNGHPKPYDVKIWEIGNELWGDWQVGHCTSEVYADRYKAFHDAMIARDPSIHMIGNGQDVKWNAPVVKEHADVLNSLSVHYLIGNGVSEDTPRDQVYMGIQAFPVHAEADILAMLKQMSDGGVKDPKMAITEMMIFTQKRAQPDCHTLAEVPFYAGILNMGIRLDGKVELITRSALVNHGGGMRKHREFVYADPIYYANKLYSTQSGRWPVNIKITGPHFDFEGLPSIPAVKDASYLDAIALLDDSGNELNVLVTNRDPENALTTTIALDGFTAQPEVKAQSISVADYMAHNTFEHPDAVTLKESKTQGTSDGITYAFPSCSLTCLTFKAR